MKLLSFREFYNLDQRRQLVVESIYQKVLKLSKLFKLSFERAFYSEKKIVLEDVLSMVEADLHQTQQDTRAMNKFIRLFKKLSRSEKMTLVNELSKPINGRKYIENNNLVKLILIYKIAKNTAAGEKAYLTIILNKQKWFEVIASQAAMKGKIPAAQAADYAQLMTLTLLGGGKYNTVNGGKYSLDAYDPFSGIPFNSFINTHIVNSSSNMFNATFNTSVANDYFGGGDKMNVVSLDKTVTNGSMSDDKDTTIGDMIPDESLVGIDPSLKLSRELLLGSSLDEQKKLLKKYLNNPKMNEKLKKAIQLRYGIGNRGKLMTLLEIGLKLGYPKTTAIQNARRIVTSAENKLKQFAKLNFQNR